MASDGDKDGCAHCPLQSGDKDGKGNSLCLAGDVYPFTLAERSLKLEIDVLGEQDLADGFSRFTQEVFAALGRPQIDAHPRAFLRVVVDGRRRNVCAHSWPTPRWAMLMIEQIQFDTSGMAPRLLYNDKPWLAQPAIYTQVFAIVSQAKRVVGEWLEGNKEAKEKK